MSFVKGNPLLSEERFIGDSDYAETMTVKGTAQKTAILFVILLITASIAWSMPELSKPLSIIGAIGGIIALLVGLFKPKTGAIAAPLYAAFEGLFLGAISFWFNQAYAGIVSQAVFITMGILLIMIGLYTGRFLKASNTLIKVVTVGTLGVCFLYIGTAIVNAISGTVIMPFLHDSSQLSIGFSLLVVVLAALNFVIDFDMVEKGEMQGAPKHMEWFGAMSIMVTLIWLYINILRLLSKLAGRD